MQGTSFISYSRVDQLFARRLYEDLKSAGVDVWLDQNDIKLGELWDKSVEAALKESTAVIVILSPESVASRSVLDEVFYALDKKRVVPVLLRDCEIPYRIARLHYTDFQADYASALKHLISTLSFPVGDSLNLEPPNPDPPPSPPSPKPPPPKPAANTTWRKALYGVAVAVAVVLAISAYLAYKRSAGVFVPPPNWAPSFDDPQLADCRGNQLCVAKKAHADSLQAIKNWRAQFIGSPLLEDCMSYPPCVERKKAVANQAKSQSGARLLQQTKIVSSTLADSLSSPSSQTPRPPSPAASCGPFTLENFPDCCA